VKELSERRPFPAFADAYFTPLAVPLLCHLISQSVAAGLTGTYHACGAERLSKYEFAIRLARWVGLAEDFIRRGSLREAGLLAPRPADMSLSTEKLSRALGRPMPAIDESFGAVFGASASG
jgi:dTDP-4-dehydrorhamnose reductase